jgi:hypothetical protein
MKLPRQIRDRSGKTLKTSDEARRYVLDKPEARPNYQTWKHAAELLLDKAASAEAITRQIELALLMDVDLDARFASEQQAGT